MGSYRGKHIPDEFNSDYIEVEDQEEHWYWYMAGYEDGLLDDYNREYPIELKRLHQDVASMHQQAAARERVLNGLQDRYEELRALGYFTADARTNKSSEEKILQSP